MRLLQFLFVSIFLTTVGLSFCSGLNILHIVPGLSRSHLMFNYKFSVAMHNLGHNVTTLSIAPIPGFDSEWAKMKIPDSIQEVRFIPKINFSYAGEFLKIFKELTYNDPNMKDGMNIGDLFTYFWSETCDQMIYNETVLEPLRHTKFDLGMTHYFDVCPIALFHILGIEQKQFYAAGTYIQERTANTMGLPSAPSYIPQSTSKYTDYMTFAERIHNLVRVVLFGLLFPSMPGSLEHVTNRLFKAVPNEDRPDLNTLPENMVGIAINGEPALEFPRPFTRDAMFLGDLSAQKSKSSQDSILKTAEWSSLVDSGNKGVIVFSLGTLARTEDMPDVMKNAFVDAFSQFPDYTILWKYDGAPPAHLNQSHSHIHFMDWLPQAHLLNHLSTRLFITHGGYNSLLEATHAAVPMLFIPLFADQYVNAMKAHRNRLGLALNKVELTTESVYRSINDLLTNEKYKRNCIKYSSMMKDKPFDPLLALKSYLNHAHVSGWHNKKSLYGRQLTFIQYHCLDVMTLCLAVLLSSTLLCIYTFKYALKQSS